MKFSTVLAYTLAVTGIALTASILPASAKPEKSEKPEKPAEVVVESQKPEKREKAEKPAEVVVESQKQNTKEVPEPLTILGSIGALGLGSMLKKQADKNKNQAITKDTLS